MAKTVRVTTDNKIEIMDIPWRTDCQNQAIEAECTEIVKTQIMRDLFKDSIVMLVDESGVCKRRPMNRLASWLYGMQVHGCQICGDVIFGRIDGPHLKPLKNAELVKFFLKDNFEFLEEMPDEKSNAY